MLEGGIVAMDMFVQQFPDFISLHCLQTLSDWKKPASQKKIFNSHLYTIKIQNIWTLKHISIIIRKNWKKWFYHRELRHDKTNKMRVRPAKTQISLGIRPVWSESSLCAWRNLGSLATHWAHSEDSDRTGQMPRLIWVFAGHTLTLLVLSCPGS